MSSINDLIRLIRRISKEEFRPSFFYAEITNISPLRLAFNGLELISEQIMLTNTSKTLITSNNMLKGDTVLIKANYEDDNSIYSVLLVDKVVK